MSDLHSDHIRVLREIFNKANFIADLGISLDSIGEGWCETSLLIQSKHLQQDGFVHAGVLATIADHTAGGAGGTTLRENEGVLSIEFKINMLRPAIGESLRCRGAVLKAGRNIIVAESEVFARSGDDEKLVAKATVTLAVARMSG